MGDTLLPPRQLDAQRAASLWDETLTFLERGKREDEAGNYSSAIVLFSAGVDGLRALSNVSKRDDILQQYQEILQQYSARIQELHMLLLQSTATATAAAAARAATPAGQPNSEPAASALAQGRLCAELAILADQAGEPEDETIKLYMAAAEHYMAAMKLDEDASARAQHRTRLMGLLERAEALKNPSAAAGASERARAPAAL